MFSRRRRSRRRFHTRPRAEFNLRVDEPRPHHYGINAFRRGQHFCYQSVRDNAFHLIEGAQPAGLTKFGVRSSKLGKIIRRGGCHANAYGV